MRIENLSIYRNQIYGISIIWIMLFHGKILPYVHLEKISPFISDFLSYGNVGVDIFLYLSGISCFYAFYKREDYDLFLCRRMLRVLPPYLIWGGICWFIIDIISGKSFKRFLLDLSLYSFWKEGEELFWYVAIIILLYMLYPLIYYSLFKNGKLYWESFFLWMATTFTFNAYLKNFESEIYENIEIATCRIPVFLCGCLSGYYVYFKKNLSYSFYILCAIFALGSYYICNNEYLPILGFRYTYLIIGISLCIVFAFLLSIVPFKTIHNILKFFGDISLELYIVHIALRYFFMHSAYYVKNCFTEYLFLLIISVVVAFILSKVSTKIKNIFERLVSL